MEEISDSSNYDASFPLFGSRRARVLTPSGAVFGRVSNVQSNANMTKVLGVVVKRGVGEIYVGREYFDQIGKDSFILNEEPSVLLKDMAVISSEGERVG